MGLVAAACGSTGNNTADSIPTGGTPTQGGKAVFAEPPATTVNYIWPFMPTADLSVLNFAFQTTMYRPLYFFGTGNQPTPNTTLSLADPPSFSPDGKTITVNLRPYMWSDGTPVDSKSVMFWVNMEKSEKQNWGDYTPGLFPDNLVSATATSPTQVVFVMDKAYSQTWLLYNELSQITPFPEAWDKTSDTQKSDCSTNTADCPGVYTYLSAKAKNLPGYATDPIWQVVDGPFKVKSFGTDGSAAIVPNPAYSGPVKARLDEVDFAPFAQDTAEYNVLASGSNSIQVGYVPLQDVPAKPKNAAVGSNPLSSKGYYMDPWTQFAINFFPINMSNPTVGPIFQQAYVRQAIQSVVDQDAVLNGPARGYGSPTYGPVPVNPPTFASPGEQSNPTPFSIDNAKQLLSSHGWTVTPNGTDTCTSPGSGPDQCGAGITAGEKLQFDIQYAEGQQWIDGSMQALKSNASLAGITINLSTAPFDTVAANASPCTPQQSGCTWEAENWGGGWTYAPDYYPSGETLFQTGGGSNYSSYSDPQNDSLIAASLTNSDPSALYAYQDYLAKQSPMIWQPNVDYQLTEVANNLRGVVPQNAYLNITPEYWYYVK